MSNARNSDQPPLAVVGMACCLPGAPSLDAFWELVRDGRCAVDRLPENRFDRSIYYDPRKGIRGKSYTDIGGLVDHALQNRDGVPLNDLDIILSDPCHVKLCEVAADACRDAGLDPFAIPEALRRAGVYVGHSRGSELSGDIVYAVLVEQMGHFLHEVEGFDALSGGTDKLILEMTDAVRSQIAPRFLFGAPDPSGYQAAGLIAQMLKLDGPCATVNAACASSLQALALASRALASGYLDMAIVGGASYCKPDEFVVCCQAHAVSPNGSWPFDADADGMVPSEGYAAIVVKLLDRAIADGDRIHAVVTGIGMSADGRGKSLWAPRKEGQIEAMLRAYASPADLARLQYIEAHATSTQLGDATELAALAEVIGPHLPPGTRIPVGTLKGNVGHTLESAGLAALVKTILAMEHQTIPPAKHIRKLTSAVDWDNFPLYVPTMPTPWPRWKGQPCMAGINAFGIGGLNVHVAISEYVPAETKAESPAAPPRMTHVPTAPPEPIAVIGMGAVLPGARTIDAVWELLTSGRDPLCEAPRGRWFPLQQWAEGERRLWRRPLPRGGYLADYSYDWRRHKIPPKQIAAADPLQYMILDAVDQALAQAGLDQRPFDRKRTGVYVGAMTSSAYYEQMHMFHRLPEFRRTLTAALRRRGVPDDQIAAAAERFEQVLVAHMPAILDETGSFAANTLATRITKTFDLMGCAGAVDAGVASGAVILSACIDSLRAGECDMMVCAAGQRPIGMPVFLELAAAGGRRGDGGIAIEELDSFAPAEGAVVLLLKRLSDAERDGDPIRAVIRSYGVARADELPAAARSATTRALAGAGLDARHLELVETSGLPLVDRDEAGAIRATLAESGADVPCETVAKQIGFSAAGSFMAALVKATLALEHGKCPEYIEPGQVVSRPLPHSKWASVTSSCKGQLAYHFVLENPHAVARDERPAREGVEPLVAPVRAPSHRLPVLSSAADVVALAGSWSEPAASASSLAIVRFGAGSLTELVSQLADPPAWHEGERNWAEHDRLRLAIVARDAADLAHKCRIATFELGIPWRSLLLADCGVFWHEACERPRLVFLFPDQDSAYDGMLQGLFEDWPPAREITAELDARLREQGCPSLDALVSSVSAPNKPSHPALALLATEVAALEVLRTRGIKPEIVTGQGAGQWAALVAAGALTFSEALDMVRHRPTRLPLAVPTVPYFDPASRRLLMEANELRAALAEPSGPASWSEVIRALATGDRPTVFLEVGPQQVLTRLVRRTLAPAGVMGGDWSCVAIDRPPRGGCESLGQIEACLAVRGLERTGSPRLAWSGLGAAVGAKE